MMAIYGVIGKPGCGKTFWVLKHLTQKYFEWSKIFNEWFKKGNFEVVTNIEEIKLENKNLDEMIRIAGGINKFFEIEYQRKVISKLGRVVYIIDEARNYFPRGLKDSAILSMLQYHRHLGIDFYLMNPTTEGLSWEVIALMEYQVVGTSRSKRLLDEFRYKKIVEGDTAGRMVLRPDNRIFKIYKSMHREGLEDIQPLVRKYVIYIFIAGLIAFLGFSGFTHFLKGKKGASEIRKESKVLEAKVIENKETPSLKEKIEVKEIQGGLQPVSGANVKQVDNPTNGKTGVIDYSDYVEIEVVKAIDGSPVIYSRDGRFFGYHLVDEILKNGLEVNGRIYVKKILKGGLAGRQDRPSTQPLGRRGGVVDGEKKGEDCLTGDCGEKKVPIIASPIQIDKQTGKYIEVGK